MKKFLLFIVVLCLICSVAMAEVDVSSMTLEELLELRSEISCRIVELYQEQEPEIPEGSLGTIAELFPDEPFAMAVRDALGKLSISQPVTQDELDTVDEIMISSPRSFGDISSIEGVGHLRNLEKLTIINRAAENMTELPEELYQLKNLQRIHLHYSGVQSISPSIGNLTNLIYLELSGSKITGLPDELINCTSLKTVDISYTDITEVPAVLFSMPDVKVSMEGTNVK